MVIKSYLPTFAFKMKNIAIGFLCIFAFMTIFNDFFMALDLNGFYLSNFSKYLVAALCSVSIFFLKKKKINQNTAS